MPDILQRLQSIGQHIEAAESKARRASGSVQLLAVSKTKPAQDVATAYRYGQRRFGESYLQEALHKQRALACFAIEWHFIGPIQSNKTRPIAEHFSWVHSVDRLKIAKRLSEQRPAHLSPLNICLQVNISDEASKSGFKLDELAEMVTAVEDMPNLRLRGVMAIPQPNADPASQGIPYRRLHQAVTALNNPRLDTFSFGMTGDLNAAIAEGSTIVRIGTALFGPRSTSTAT